MCPQYEMNSGNNNGKQMRFYEASLKAICTALNDVKHDHVVLLKLGLGVTHACYNEVKQISASSLKIHKFESLLSSLLLRVIGFSVL